MEKQKIIFWLIAWYAQLSSFHITPTNGLVYEVTFIPNKGESTPSSSAPRTTNATIERNTEDDGQLAPVMVAAIVGGCMVLLMLIAVLAVCIFYRVRECKEDRENDDDESNPNLLDVHRTSSISRSGKESLNAPSFMTVSTVINDSVPHMYDTPDVSLDLDNNVLTNGPSIAVIEYVDTVCPNGEQDVKQEEYKDNLSNFSVGGISLTSDELEIDLYSSNDTVELTELPRSKLYTGVDNGAFIDDEVHYAVADTTQYAKRNGAKVSNNRVSVGLNDTSSAKDETHYVKPDIKGHVYDISNGTSNNTGAVDIKGIVDGLVYAVPDTKQKVENTSNKISNNVSTSEGVDMRVDDKIIYTAADNKQSVVKSNDGRSTKRTSTEIDRVVNDEILYDVADTNQHDGPKDGISNDRMSISTQECLDVFDRILNNHSNDMMGIDLSNTISKEAIENIYVASPIKLEQTDNTNSDDGHLFGQAEIMKAKNDLPEQTTVNDLSKPNEVTSDTDVNNENESTPRPLPRRKHSLKINGQVQEGNNTDKDKITSNDAQTKGNTESDIV